MWKESGINKYPNVVLHDCLVTNIEKNGDDIIVDFDRFDSSGQYGFWIKDIEKNMYYRTGSSQIVIKKYDIDYTSIKEIRTQQLSEKLFFETVSDIEPKVFIKKVNMGKWKFEVVEEFYSTDRALYIGRIHTKKKNQKSFWCCIKLQFKELLYLWSEIRYDCIW